MTALTLREAGASPKNSALTNAEMDNNFVSLDQGINTLNLDLAEAKTVNLALAEQLHKLKVRLLLAL